MEDITTIHLSVKSDSLLVPTNHTSQTGPKVSHGDPHTHPQLVWRTPQLPEFFAYSQKSDTEIRDPCSSDRKSRIREGLRAGDRALEPGQPGGTDSRGKQWQG